MTEILVAMVVVAALSALAVAQISRARATAARSTCDVRLKALMVGLDAFRQENGRYPELLKELTTKKYLQEPDALRCPSDRRRRGSYQEYYAIRAPRDSAELPMIVCPLHEADSDRGGQAYKGVYTKQFAVKSARLVQAVGTTVERPGRKPITGVAGMELHGGDRIQTKVSGSATIVFADGSSSTLQGKSSMTVLESFVAGQTNASLYTLVRQTLGVITHRVTHGSKFDVVTPTATAGALGTAFIITVNNDGGGTLQVTESKVYLSTASKTEIVPAGTTISTIPACGNRSYNGNNGGAGDGSCNSASN